MPVYEYMCDDCGDFVALSSISARNDAQACPQCGDEAYRVMLSAPRLATMASTTYRAHAKNERAQHEPTHSASHVHGPSCGCGKINKSTTQTGANGAKAFPTKRPWMISH